jgi:ureidoacrylate peracid hydrolase
MASTHRISIDAQPEPLALDTASTAVLVVDMQNDFGTEGGMFHRAGVDIAPIKAVVPAVARVLAAARRAALPIVYLKMEHRPDLSDTGAASSPYVHKCEFFKIGSPAAGPRGEKGRILVRDTWNTDIVPELRPEPSDIIVSKHRYSGFYETDLHLILRARGINTLIVTGCTTSVCVESTIRDAAFRDYTCVLLSDCCAEPIGSGLPRSNHEATLLLIQILFGWTATSEAFIDTLRAARATVPSSARTSSSRRPAESAR